MKRVLVIFCLFAMFIAGCSDGTINDYLTGTKCVIYYTSVDGRIVVPNNLEAFDANIISNTYKDGVGAIKLDREITKIGFCAFYCCDNLRSITIPNTVRSIEPSAFVYCDNLEKFSGRFASTDGRCLIVDGELCAFAPAKLTEYAIPAEVTKIGESALSCLSDIRYITMTDSVTSIASSAFENCVSLESVTLSNNITYVGESAFATCPELREFNTELSSEDGRTLIINDEVVAFAPANIVEYTIEEGVTAIGSRAFFGCHDLHTLTIPANVTKIGEYAFSGSNIFDLYCHCDTPPAGGYGMFNYNSSQLNIYVPYQSMNLYLSTEYWRDYSSNINGFDSGNGGTISKSQYSIYVHVVNNSWPTYGLWSWNDINSNINYTGGRWPGRVYTGVTYIGDYLYYYWEMPIMAEGDENLMIIFNDLATFHRQTENYGPYIFDRDLYFVLYDSAVFVVNDPEDPYSAL